METATQTTTECHCMKNAEGVIEEPSGTCPEHGAFVPQETPAQEQQVSVAQLATAYLVLNSAVTYGAYWPEEITGWAQGLMRGEKRVGIELVREAMLPVYRDPAFQKLLQVIQRFIIDCEVRRQSSQNYSVDLLRQARKALRLARQSEGERP